MLRFSFKRLFVLVAIFSLFLLCFIAGKSLQLSSVADKAKAQNNRNDFDSKVNHILEGVFKANTQNKITISNSFKPALERPANYTSNGLGELGVEVVLKNLSKAEQNKEEKLRGEYGINQLLSEKISLHRTLKDPRPPQCTPISAFDYSKFPPTSVVVVFYNEGWSTLLRTIYSILHNTHDDILVELILVDDCSSLPHLKKPLEDHIKSLPKTRLIRTKQREGIVRSRLLGLSEAQGEVIAFVDCHCECTIGWLEPLLLSIMEDESTLAVPVTDDIDSETFRYYYGNYEPSIGGFTWDLFFHWRPMSSTQRSHQKNYAQPIRTPTISGGLFAINVKYFRKIGSYDSGMDVWGGENVEVSFRTWMCGGRILIHPCSHIGHVSRNKNTYSRESVWKNVARAAEVWFYGKYKQLFQNRLHKAYREADFGDISERKELIKKLKCHNFDWYLENVFPEKYVPENIEGFYGTVHSVAQERLCLDLSGVVLTTYSCHGMVNQYMNNCTSRITTPHFQQFELNSQHLLRQNEEECVTPGKELLITVTKCPEKHQPIPESLLWTHTKEGLLLHFNSNKCMGVVQRKFNNALAMIRCDLNDKFQQWKFQKVD